MSKLTRLLKLLLETDEAWPPPTAVNFIGRSTPRGRHGAGREVSRRGLRRLDAAPCCFTCRGGFLRQRGRLDVLARLWKAHGLYDLVLREWSSMLSSGREDVRLTTAQIVSEMVEVLRTVRAVSQKTSDTG